jgi:integrase
MHQFASRRINKIGVKLGVKSLTPDLNMPAKALTHTAIASAKPGPKPHKLSDLNRLYVLVSTAGSKTWKWAYRLHDKDCTYTIGRFPEIGVKEARDLRAAAEKLVRQGIHPADHEQEQIAKVKAVKDDTLGGVASEWFAFFKPKWGSSYAKQAKTYLDRYVINAPIGKRPIRSITPKDMTGLITSIAVRTELGESEIKETAPHIAIMTRQLLHGVFQYAIREERCDQNPVAAFKASEIINKPPTKNNKALNEEQLQTLLQKLPDFTGNRRTIIALELLILTFTRTTELRLAQWPEINFDKRQWTIPAARMKVKNRGDHLVPLSDQAIALLTELKAYGVPKSGPQYLFPSTKSPNGVMSVGTINGALRALGLNGEGSLGFAGHGARGTASTQLHEMGFAPHVIETQLAHAQRNAVAGTYNKAQYLAERINMMNMWGAHVAELKGVFVP